MADVLVTGGTGVLGRKVVERLLREGRGVRILSRRPLPQAPPRVRAIWGDLAGGSPSLREAVAAAKGPVATVGDQPDCSEIALAATGVDPGFSPGAMARLELDA